MTTTRLYTIYITRTAPAEAQRIYQYLCDYHAPVESGTLTPGDEPTATIVSVRSRSVTDAEVANYGADECDACRGDVKLSAGVA